jgi:glycosyltransferase involved in cell wall biosynthesis
VLDQTYENWELVIVDDGSTDDTAGVIARLADARIRTIEGTGSGTCAARNIGLSQAKGDVIAYLDDDNLLEPLWLEAVSWAFAQRPDVDVLYGARVIDDVGRVHGRETVGEPMLQFEPWDRAALEWANFADMGVLAHRSGLAEATFDESLVQMGDWDLFLRLTEDKDPLMLPVVAMRYFTTQDVRLTDLDSEEHWRALVRAKVADRKSARGGGVADRKSARGD